MRVPASMGLLRLRRTAQPKSISFGYPSQSSKTCLAGIAVCCGVPIVPTWCLHGDATIPSVCCPPLLLHHVLLYVTRRAVVESLKAMKIQAWTSTGAYLRHLRSPASDHGKQFACSGNSQTHEDHSAQVCSSVASHGEPAMQE